MYTIESLGGMSDEELAEVALEIELFGEYCRDCFSSPGYSDKDFAARSATEEIERRGLQLKMLWKLDDAWRLEDHDDDRKNFFWFLLKAPRRTILIACILAAQNQPNANP